MTTRVVLGDDSDVMRTSIVSMLHEDSSIRVVGEASSFAQTVEMIADLKPDVLLLDLHLAEKRHFAPPSVKLQLAGVEHFWRFLSQSTTNPKPWLRATARRFYWTK
jgi:DNA-binding NarL/FixJ family response regulator